MSNFVGRGFYLALGAGAIGGAVLLFMQPKPGPETPPSAQETSAAPSAAADTSAPGSTTAQTVAELRQGTMQKLQFHNEAKPVSQTAFLGEDGDTLDMEAFEGKHVILNFWATWCAPCRKEMPMLSALQTEFGGPDFEIVTVSTGRGNPIALTKFFDEIGVSNLPEHRDPDQAFARDMGVLGLPITVMISPDGEEVARMQGDAHWDSPSAKAIVAAWVAGKPLQ
ncbi:MAG: TlpA disulfide reductase family protein [Pseudomonadota bacterium]